jgi:hypothetical protein
MTICGICGSNVVDDCVSIVPSETCFRMQRGSTTRIDCVLTDGQGEPIDITFDTVTLTIKNYKGGTSKIQKSNAPGSHLDPENGRTVFEIIPADITDPQTGDAFYWVFEVRRIQPGGVSAVHIEGQFIVDPQVGV